MKNKEERPINLPTELVVAYVFKSMYEQDKKTHRKNDNNIHITYTTSVSDFEKYYANMELDLLGYKNLYNISPVIMDNGEINHIKVVNELKAIAEDCDNVFYNNATSLFKNHPAFHVNLDDTEIISINSDYNNVVKYIKTFQDYLSTPDNIFEFYDRQNDRHEITETAALFASDLNACNNASCFDCN